MIVARCHADLRDELLVQAQQRTSQQAQRVHGGSRTVRPAPAGRRDVPVGRHPRGIDRDERLAPAQVLASQVSFLHGVNGKTDVGAARRAHRSCERVGTRGADGEKIRNVSPSL